MRYIILNNLFNLYKLEFLFYKNNIQQLKFNIK